VSSAGLRLPGPVRLVGPSRVSGSHRRGAWNGLAGGEAGPWHHLLVVRSVEGGGRSACQRRIRVVLST